MINEDQYEHYLKALLAGNRFECRAFIQSLLDKNIEITELYESLFRKSMYKVGELWECNQITVANEHLATAITDSLLTLTYPEIIKTERIGKKAVISCCTNEFHQLGAKMAADILELNGWDSHFLGANTPTSDIAEYIDKVIPDIIGLSFCILQDRDDLQKSIEIINTDFSYIDMIIGGQAFLYSEAMDILRQYPHIEYIPSLKNLEEFITGNLDA